MDVGDTGDPQPVRAARGEGPLDVVEPAVRSAPWHRRARPRGTGDPTQAKIFNQPLRRATRHRLTVYELRLAGELGVDLTDPLDAVVVLVNTGDDRFQLLITNSPGRRWPIPSRVVGARNDRHVRLGQRGADRLDSKLGLVLLDVIKNQQEERSSSAAKKADADRRIAFARRSSSTSRSSLSIFCASVVVVPGPLPWSTSAWVTQPRRVSALIPSYSPMR